MAFKDSCRAWMVALAGSLLYFLTNGNIRCSGVLFVPLMEAENVNKGTASWPFNLPGLAAIVSGPLTGFLRARFSVTAICLFASALFVLGQIPAYFTTNIIVLSFSYGIARGFGVPMISVLGAMTTNTAFRRHRSTAMGLTTSGGPLGGLLLPLLGQWFLTQYGLRGTFLMLAGVSMHAFVFSLIYLTYEEDETSIKTNDKKIQDERTPLLSSSSDQKLKTEASSSATSNQDLSTAEKDNAGLLSSGQGEKRFNDQHTMSTESKTQKNQQNKENKTNTKPKIWDTRIIKNIFTNRGFYLVSSSQTSGAIAIQTFAQVIVDYLKERNFTETDSVFMISSLSAGEILGKLVLGIIPDKKIISVGNHTALCQAVGAVMAILLTIFNDLYALMVISFFLGAFQGSVLSVSYVQITDYVSKDELPLALSFMKAFAGLGFFLIPVIIGIFRDTLGSYDYLFYFLASILFALSLVWTMEGICRTRKLKNRDPL